MMVVEGGGGGEVGGGNVEKSSFKYLSTSSRGIFPVLGSLDSYTNRSKFDSPTGVGVGGAVVVVLLSLSEAAAVDAAACSIDTPPPTTSSGGDTDDGRPCVPDDIGMVSSLLPLLLLLELAEESRHFERETM